jgi:carboxymethylenebutenolidase
MQSAFPSGGQSIRITIHEPAAARAPWPAIVLLHGSGGNIERWNENLAPQLVALGIAVYAPHYFDRTGTVRADLTAITDGKHVPLWLDTLDAALRWVATRPGVDANRIALVGTSLGAFLALSHAAIVSSLPHPQPALRCLVDLSGGLPEPYRAQATSRFPPTLILHGDADDIVPITFAHDLDQLLTQLHVPHETRILPHEGHWFSGSGQMQLLLAVAAFLRKHL